jgi:hypothetical protein
LLRREIKPYRGARGEGIRQWCKAHAVNPTHVSEFLNGKRSPAPDVLGALDLEWQIVRKRRAQSEDARKKGE